MACTTRCYQRLTLGIQNENRSLSDQAAKDQANWEERSALLLSKMDGLQDELAQSAMDGTAPVDVEQLYVGRTTS